MRKILLSAAVLASCATSAFSQCVEWVNPAPDVGWTDFDPVPCNGESQEIEAFEVWQSEAYAFEGVVTGGSYTFSHCNGPGAGSWTPEYTVIAPSGDVETFGPGDGDGCSITWTASQDGTYLVVINEAGNCGVEGSTDNGFPMIMTNSGGEECAAPPVFVEGAESFEEGELPTCWSVIDADGDGNNFIVSDGVQGFDGEWAIRGESFINGVGALTPDNYLISPQLILGEGDSLYYVIAAVDPNFAAENYSILVSTTGNDVEDFTDEVFNEVLSSTDWQGRSIDLSDYDNETIYIAFRHFDVSDEFAFLIDAVALPGEVVDCSTVGTEDTDISNTFKVFPNPTTGLVNLTNGGETGEFNITVFDGTGRLIEAQRAVLTTGASLEMDLGQFEAGMYTVRFVSEERVGTQRVVIR